MKYRLTLSTLLATFAVCWLKADYTDALYDMQAMELVRTAVFWFGVPLVSLSMQEIGI